MWRDEVYSVWVRNMQDVIELTVLTPDEWLQWRELRLRALAEAPYAFGARIEDWQDADEARWRQRLSLPGSYNLIARLNGRRVGMASGVPAEEAGAAELISMWAAPDSRGRGVGTHSSRLSRGGRASMVRGRCNLTRLRGTRTRSHSMPGAGLSTSDPPARSASEPW